MRDLFGVTTHDLRVLCLMYVIAWVVVLALAFWLRMWPEDRRTDHGARTEVELMLRSSTKEETA